MAETVSTKPFVSSSRRSERATVFRGQFQKTRWCCFFRLQGGCKHGASCHFAHSQEELSSRPDLRKTSLCKQWAEGTCPITDGSCRFAHGQEELMMTTTFKGHGKNSEKNAVVASETTAREMPDQRQSPGPKYQANMLASPASPAVCDKEWMRLHSLEDDETSEGSSPRSWSAGAFDSRQVTQGSTNSGSGGASDFEYGSTPCPAGNSPWESCGNRSSGVGYPPSPGYAGANSGDNVPGVRRQSRTSFPVHMPPMPARSPDMTSNIRYRTSNPQAAGQGGGPSQYYMMVPSLLSEGGLDGDKLAALLAAAVPEYYED